jgi:hypothetical protein
MRQYSIDNVEVAWLALDFKEGLAEGSSITEARNAPTFSQKVGAVGKATRTLNPDRTGTMSILVDQESQLHNQLHAIARADRNPATRTQVGDMVLTDITSGEKFTWENTYIMTDPDTVRATESSVITWVFNFEKAVPTAAETLENVVGG